MALLSGCGSDSQTSVMDSSTARGTLVENPPLRIASLSAAALNAQLQAGAAAGASGQILLATAGAPVCGVDFNYMHYWTVNASTTGDVPVEASGALMVPTGAAPQCSGPRPVLLYAHGTQFDKNANIADPTDPNNTEGGVIAAMFAAQGYIVVAPNYVGYDTASGTYHPFVNADALSKDMMDALSAGRAALGHVLASTTTDNGKLFITGYSEGGYVAMATHRAMQAAGKTVTASAPMSGPYALAAFIDAMFLGNVDFEAPRLGPLLTTSFQKAYGNIYASTSDVYEAAFAPTIETLLPSAMSLDQLWASGQLPQYALFHNTVWATGSPLDAVLDVPTGTNSALYMLGFGPVNLVKDSYRFAYVQDVFANPDGALVQQLQLPVQPTLLPAATPANTLRQATKVNDLRNWAPQSPTLLCGGGEDPVVYFPVNTGVMQAYWANVNKPVSPALVTVLDIDPVTTTSLTGAGGPFAATIAGFGATEAAIFAAPPTGVTGQQAVVGSYHSVVQPFCSAAARGFFSQF